jgi:hypothetical protein
MHDQHEMHLETTHPSGAEEWACPTCGRRFLMQWPPAYKKVVLEVGDEYAYHSGGKGGLSIGTASITECDASELIEEPHANTDNLPTEDSIESEDSEPSHNLYPWLKWLKNAKLDDHLDDAA